MPIPRDVLIGLVGYNKAAGNTKAATTYAHQLVVLDPRYGSADQLMQQIGL